MSLHLLTANDFLNYSDVRLMQKIVFPTLLVFEGEYKF
jgi:hypothetical protein